MFITFEGIEGSGKTTQIKKISDFLKDAGFETVVTREPGDTKIGKKIRSILLNPENKELSSLCELFLYAADRAQHLHEIIVPALENNKIVLCDRFIDSTTVYQGKARGLETDLIEEIHQISAGIVQTLKPDLTVLFDLNPEIGLKRTFKAIKMGQRSGNETRFELENLKFHEKVRQGYLELASKEKERFLVVDASLLPEQVFHGIIAGIKDRFPGMAL